MRILLLGKDGQVGWELQRILAPLGSVTALGRQELDLTAPHQIKEQVRAIKPNLIINAAAYTAVDRAEAEPATARSVNEIAPEILAGEAKRLNAALVHYSTDYVFDGTGTRPYTEADQPHPVNVYGQTKLAGEQAIQAAGVAHLILRTSWVYGLRGKNFLLTILQLARRQEPLRIVDDQIGAPTWSRFIAEATGQILARAYSTGSLAPLNDGPGPGLYHLCAGGQTTWYQFARAILKIAQETTPDHQLVPITTREYPAKAQRPPYSLLSCTRLKEDYHLALPAWETGLSLALQV